MGCGDSKDDKKNDDKRYDGLTVDRDRYKDNEDSPRDDRRKKDKKKGGGSDRDDSDDDRGRDRGRSPRSDEDDDRMELRDGDSNFFSSASFEKSPDCDYLFKILLLGSQGVGKSSLLSRFADNEFLESMRATVGVDCKIRTVELEDKTIKLQLWDTAGQERFKTVTKAFFRGAHGVIFVYDITEKKTFEQLEYWLKEVKDNAPSNAVLMLVGNKCDLKSRAVQTKDAKDFAQNKDAIFIETSAKDDTNVSKAFYSLANSILDRIKD